MVRSGKRIQPTEEQLTALGNYSDITVPAYTGGGSVETPEFARW